MTRTKLGKSLEEWPASVKRTRIQKLIGERMLCSKCTKPCFYLESKADVTEMMRLRPKLRKSFGVKVTTNAFYIKALAFAVREYPVMIGTLAGERIKIADSVNIGFAVNAPQGLVVPVVKNADEMSLAEIAKAEKLLTGKARDNSLTLAEMEGETIALSNLGVYGIDSFVGIIPPPASAIVAVGNVLKRAVPKDGSVFIRKMLSLNLAVDHRVINGVYAAKFLSCLAGYLENPQRLF